MVNSATGVAALASRLTVLSSTAGNTHCCAVNPAPSRIAQAIGLPSTPRKALPSACRMACRPLPSAPSSRDSAIQTEDVITMSAATSRMIGPLAASPSRATSSGTPMKPLFGNTATSAPMAASFQLRP